MRGSGTLSSGGWFLFNVSNKISSLLSLTKDNMEIFSGSCLAKKQYLICVGKVSLRGISILEI